MTKEQPILYTSNEVFWNVIIASLATFLIGLVVGVVLMW